MTEPQFKMLRKKAFTWILSGVLAAGGSFATYFYDRLYAEKTIELEYARFGAQVARQVQALSLDPAAATQRDALSWAAKKLSSGVEPRVIQVFPIKLPKETLESELFELNSKERRFDYVKLIDPVTRRGVRVQMDTGFLGFAGSKTPFQSDLKLGGLFFILFLIPGLFFSLWIEKRSKGALGSQVGALNSWKDQTGEQFEAVEKSLESMMDSTREVFGTLRESVQSLNEIHASYGNKGTEFQQIKETLGKLENFSDSARSVAKKMVDGGYDDVREVTFQAEKLHKFLDSLHKVSQISAKMSNQSLEQIHAVNEDFANAILKQKELIANHDELEELLKASKTQEEEPVSSEPDAAVEAAEPSDEPEATVEATETNDEPQASDSEELVAEFEEALADEPSLDSEEEAEKPNQESAA